jgi:hypothetical protein
MGAWACAKSTAARAAQGAPMAAAKAPKALSPPHARHAPVDSVAEGEQKAAAILISYSSVLQHPFEEQRTWYQGLGSGRDLVRPPVSLFFAP